MDDEIKKEIQDSYTYHFFFNHGIFDEIKHYEDLISETENFINTKVASMEDSIEEDITDQRFGKKMQYEGIFPMVLWKSLFLSTYFLLENSLDQICENLSKSNSYKLSLKDIKGNGIFRSSLFLKKVCNIEKPFLTADWTEITEFNKLRNILVHSDGYLSKSNKETKQILNKYKQINIVEYDEDNFTIYIDSEFCKYSLSKIEQILNQVHFEMNIMKTKL